MASSTLPEHSPQLKHSSINFDEPSNLEYLDLSASDEGISNSPAINTENNVLGQTEGEYYGFEDYSPESGQHDEDLYDESVSTQHDVNHNIHLPAKLARMPPRFTRRHDVPKYVQLQSSISDNEEDNSSNIPSILSRTDSGSSSSTSASLRSSQISKDWHQNGYNHGQYKRDRVAPQDYEDIVISYNAKPRLSLPGTCSVPSNLVLMHNGIDDKRYRFDPAAEMEGTSQNEQPSHLNRKACPWSGCNTNPRMEAILNGIVKLVKEDEIKTKPNSQGTNQMTANRPVAKHPLKGSKSAAVLNASKSQSPTNCNQAKILNFVRRASTISNIPAETENKKGEKKSKTAKDQLALFEAVDNFDVEKVTLLMNSDSSNINSMNEEGLSVLDIAMLTNHVPMTKTLMGYGASCKFISSDDIDDVLPRLADLTQIAKHQVNVLSGKVASATGSSLKENEKKLNQWEFKHRLFRRMKNGVEQAGTPGKPLNVKLAVSSSSSLSVKFDSPETVNGAVVTKYKVEWSCAQNFKPLAGEVFVNDLQNLSYEITGLDRGIPYFVRVTAWNIKGFGRPAFADPLFATPSSWADANNTDSRTTNFHYNTIRVNEINALLRKYRSRIEESCPLPLTGDSPTPLRKNSVMVKRGLSRLFSSSAKFQKSLKQGIYLACVFYNDDKVLVTTEDNLPVIEVDESFSGNSLQGDFDWLMKVAATNWDITRAIKQDLMRLAGLSGSHLRNQLLTAVLQLQNMMSIQDLGRLYYKPVKDSSGSIIFVLVNNILDPKLIGNMSSVKWQSQPKILKSSASNDCLVNKLPEIVFYNQVSTEPLESGLYLGYLHVKVNVENIRVLVPDYHPNIMPYTKIRDCPNVSQPEWESILNVNIGDISGEQAQESSHIVQFKSQIIKAAGKLTGNLDLTAKQIGEHRLYDIKVLEFSKDVSFIILVPPRDLVCSIQAPQNHNDNGSTENVSGFIEMPVRAFEMVHNHTYNNEFITEYARVACQVDTELLLAQQMHREAFHMEEVEQTRELLDTTKRYQNQLEEIWRGTRWLMDIITYARDKTSQGVPLGRLKSNVFEQKQIRSENHGKISDDGYHSDKLSLGGSTGSDKLHKLRSANQNNTNNNNAEQQYEGDSDQSSSSERLGPGILRVYAAYNSGLAKGTSVLLHVTSRSTAQEVIDLVVMQLNQAVMNKGMAGPLYTESHLHNFCLVAVVGVRERVLREDYRLLQLKNPWTNGKLYVRQKDNLLAALEQGKITEV